jgi:hypothetical protein
MNRFDAKRTDKWLYALKLFHQNRAFREWRAMGTTEDAPMFCHACPILSYIRDGGSAI